jgi:hypothetical protein
LLSFVWLTGTSLKQSTVPGTFFGFGTFFSWQARITNYGLRILTPFPIALALGIDLPTPVGTAPFLRSRMLGL